ncbi:MAG: SDR family oxidoreductase [Deltaproteobacteria bacterium]|nr:SDR family oxidoreductase [Deltaproteobacteria bacterium]
MVQRKSVPVAVVGASALFAGSSDAQGFWRDILSGRDLVTDVPASHWLIEDYYDPNPKAPDKTYARRGAFISPTSFDPLAFGIPPTIVPATDTAQLLALIVTQKVLEDASRTQFAEVDRERMSVILGVTSAQELINTMVSRLQRPVWTKALREMGMPEDEVIAACDRIASHYVPWQEATFPGLLGNVVAGRIANRFDLRGTNAVTDAACASALAALSMGINELATGQSDVVICGGVDTMNDICMYVCFSKTPALSPTGDCRPFSDAADGTILGEGLAMVALKRLEDAERDGDRVYAVINGLGSSSDGRGPSVYAPLPAGQRRAIDRCYEVAGYSPNTVELVEAHGTGTKAGDAAEFEGLRLAFSPSAETSTVQNQWCALGSVKSQIGHTKATAGAAGLFKAVMALHHKVLPPTIKVEKPNSKMAIESSPFYLNTQARPWIRDKSHPRRAGVSSFGFGGSNFHVTLEEYTPSAEAKSTHAWRTRSMPSELIVLSAQTPEALLARCDSLVLTGETSLDALARGSQTSFDPTLASRAALIATDLADLQRKLDTLRAHVQKTPTASLTSPQGVHYAMGDSAGEIAVLFPGQGSQYVSMGADLAMAFDAARAVWDHSASQRFDGIAVHEVTFAKPVFSDQDRAAQQAELTRTEWAQPALGLASAASLAVLTQLGLKPSCAAGHSYGELTALYAAGALDADAHLTASRTRGALMRDAAATPGAMCAVVHDVASVRALLAKWGSDVVVANHNAPTQVVLSGSVGDIEAVERSLAAEKITAKRLSVATAFHSKIVAPSSAPFAEALQSIAVQSPRFEVYGNAEAAPYPSDPSAIRERLAAQLALPVRFVDTIEAMYARGVRTFVEVGPGSVLTDLVGKILSGKSHRAIATDRKGRPGVTSLFEALGRLAVAGIPLDFAQLWTHYAPHSTTPKKKPALEMFISGSNYGKPYPPPGGASELPPPNPPRKIQAQTTLVPTPVAPTPVPQAPITKAPLAEAKALNGATHTTQATQRAPTAPTHSPRTANTMTSSRDSSDKSAPVTVLTEDVQLAWVRAYQDAQRQTVEAHASYQRAMADTQVAFLDMAKTSFAGLAAILTGQPVIASERTLAAPTQVTSVAQIAAPIAAPVYVPAPAPVAAPQPAPVVAAPVAPPKPAAAPVAAPTPAPAASAAVSVDLEKVLLEIVAEKTGYPAEMLGMQMELEGDLGIDSIKRVEILSAMRSRVPNLPEVKPSELASLRTLGQIVDYMRAQSGATTVPSSAATRLSGATAEATEPIGRFVVEMVPEAPTGLAIRGLFTATKCVVTACEPALGDAVVSALRAVGVRAEVVPEVPADADFVLCLAGLRAAPSVAEAIACNREAFATARTIAQRFTEHGGTFVTLQDTGGDFGLSGSVAQRAWLGGIAALARTVAHEWPLATVQAMDLACAGLSVQDQAAAIVRELLQGSGTREVGLVGAVRAVPRAVAAPSVTDAKPALSDGAVIVATGGARGVTAACLIDLAARIKGARVALLGRTALLEDPAWAQQMTNENALKRAFLLDAQSRGEKVTPVMAGAATARVLANREVRSTMAAITATGASAMYLATDVQDATALRAALAQVRASWGPITALVHGAGVLADKLVAQKTQEQFDRVFDTKVLALETLLDATSEDPLRAICLFSSIAARTGNTGQSDYAMANEVLNLVASAEAHRRGAACVVRSLGWGPWAGGMVTPELAQHFASMSVPLVGLVAGANAFSQEFCSETRGTHVVLAGASNAHERAHLAAGALAGDADRELRSELWVSQQTHAYLADHAIQGLVVVPVVVAMEWLMRAAKTLAPGLHVRAMSNVRVLSGIKLERFANEGDTLTLRAKKLSNGAGITAQVELRGRNDRLHYSARVELGAPLAASTHAVAMPSGEAFVGEIYDGHMLFHGERFKVLSNVRELSTHGALGDLSGLTERGWNPEPFCWDPAAMDGALQLAVLWAQRALGGATLPMAIASANVFCTGALVGPLRCVVQRQSAQDSRAVSDVFVLGPNNELCVALHGVETVLRPDAPVQATV